MKSSFGMQANERTEINCKCLYFIWHWNHPLSLKSATSYLNSVNWLSCRIHFLLTSQLKMVTKLRPLIHFGTPLAPNSLKRNCKLEISRILAKFAQMCTLVLNVSRLIVVESGKGRGPFISFQGSLLPDLFPKSAYRVRMWFKVGALWCQKEG